MAKVIKSFSLDLNADRDILNYIEGLPRGDLSKVVREALRAHLEQPGRGGITLGDVYQGIKRIERKLEAGVILGDVSRETSGNGHDDPVDDAPGTEAAAMNLDAWETT